MSRPKAYDPQPGYKYQILCRYNRSSSREWEHCDYAKTTKEKNDLLEEYRLAYHGEFSFKVIALPKQYWRKGEDGHAEN